jgi:hypothetical protein
MNPSTSVATTLSPATMLVRAPRVIAASTRDANPSKAMCSDRWASRVRCISTAIWLCRAVSEDAVADRF